MKGVILAGGYDNRLFPSTKITSKYLLPVFDKPMIYHSIKTLKESGIRDILIISSAEFSGDFMRILGSGSEFGVHFTFKIQNGCDGNAQALSLAKDFVNGENFAVIFADNIFENNFSDAVFYFQKGAQLFIKKSENPSQFGVVETREDGSIRSLEEKPDFPKSHFIQTGFFLFDAQVFDFISKIKPSKKGFWELTDVLNLYRQENELKASKVSGSWIDIDSHEDLLEASILTQENFLTPDTKKVQKVSQNNTPKVTLGLLTFNSEKYLKPCLNSLLKQDYKNLEIVILDNNSVDETVHKLEKNYPNVRCIKSLENLGFGAGHNEIIRQTDGQFYACLNIDMIFEPNFISTLVKTLQKDPTFGSVGGKLKRWDFDAFQNRKNQAQEMGKTNFIDSIGLRILKSHRFEDIGQGDVDYGQFNQAKDVFGISGAAILFRKDALEDVGFKNKNSEKIEYFDESMFLYKEDVDLAYRLQWAGWKAHYTPNAVAFHDRTTQALGQKMIGVIKNRAKKSRKINQWSFLNHQILLKKNFSDTFSQNVKTATFWYNFKVTMYLFFFETETLFPLFKMRKLKKKISAQKKSMPRRVSQMEIEKFMEN